MNFENVIIRKALKEDIEKIANIKINGWKTAYINIVDKETLDNLDVNKEIDEYYNHYSLNDIFVAVIDNEVLGFCRVCNYDDTSYDYEKNDCEIREIYVRNDVKRMKIGSKLFNYVLNYFKDKGKTKLYLGVFKDNYDARKFYEKLGGILDKEDCLIINDKSYPIVSYMYDLNVKE